MNIVFDLVDNTKTDDIFDGVNVKGYSHVSKLMFPNMGIWNDKEIIFFNYGMVKVGNRYSISKQNVFMQEGKLVKDGIIVKRTTVNQSEDDYIYRTQDFFEVVDSNCIIPIGAFVIIGTRSAYRFIRDKETLYFANRQNVLLFTFEDKILPGTEYEFIEKIDPEPFCKEETNKGMLKGKKVIFGTKEAEINLEGKETYIVRRTEIFGEDE